MKKWEDRFFALNKDVEVEITDREFDDVACAARQLRWTVDDQFWAPDLHVSRLIRGDSEMFLIQETYFGPKLTGNVNDILELREAVQKIDPNRELLAGKIPYRESKTQNHASEFTARKFAEPQGGRCL